MHTILSLPSVLHEYRGSDDSCTVEHSSHLTAQSSSLDVFVQFCIAQWGCEQTVLGPVSAGSRGKVFLSNLNRYIEYSICPEMIIVSDGHILINMISYFNHNIVEQIYSIYLVVNVYNENV